MIQKDLVTYLKKANEEGHSFDAVKSVLLQQGWNEQDIIESSLAASAPSAPQAPSAPRAPVKAVEKKIPDHYISSLSILLAGVLFFCLITLTGQVMDDIESVLVPHAANSLSDTPAYQKLAEKYPAGRVAEADRLRLEVIYKQNHEQDKINLLFVHGVVSIFFWGLAFAMHYMIGGASRHYLPLSAPFFITAGLYLADALFGVIEQLFKEEAQTAIYATLVLFIIIVTVSFMFYQRRSHTQGQEGL